LSRSQTGISRKNNNKQALKVLYSLHNAGYHACLVGGAVRDLLLGLTPKDFDVATDATPEQVNKLFRNCRLIGRRFRLAHIHFGRQIIEVATFRADHHERTQSGIQNETGRIVRDNVFGEMADDVWRRDFTANALYYDIADFSVIDFVGGYTVYNDEVYDLSDWKDLAYGDVFEATENADGSISFFVQYYNGGCGLDEAIGYALDNLEKS